MNQTENQHQNYDNEEIDLRDIFRTLGKWKYTIIGFTLICTLLSGIFSWFFVKPTYEARAVTVLTSSSPLTSGSNYVYVLENDPAINSKEVSDNIDQLVKLAQLDSSNFNQLLNSVTVLQNTIDALSLEQNINELKDIIKIESAKDQKNVAEVVVESENPEQAAQIANMLVKQTTVYLDEINKRKMQRLEKILNEQLNMAKDQLNDSYARLGKYQSQLAGSGKNNPAGYDTGQKQLESEIKIKENLINSLSAKIVEVEMLQSIKSAENQIITVSQAMVPDKPSKPNKKLNLAVAAALGLMVSVFGVFLIEYLNNEK